MRVTKKPSGRVIFFFFAVSRVIFFFFAVNACNQKTVRWCNFFFFRCKSCKPAYTTYSEKKKLHDYTVFLLRAFTAKKKNYTNYNIHGFLFSAGTFWPFWAKMYRLGVFSSQPVHFGHSGRKCTGWGFFYLCPYILAILGENVPPEVFFILSPYILAVLGENVPAGGFFFSAGTFWPFRAKVYRLGFFLSLPVHFGRFGLKCTGWGFVILRRSSFSMFRQKCTGWRFFYSHPVHFGHFWAKLCRLGVFCFHPVHFPQKWPKCTA